MTEISDNKIVIRENVYKLIQLNRIDEIVWPDAAFSLVKKRLLFNRNNQLGVKIIIVLHNNPISDLRVFKSAQIYGINITKGILAGDHVAYEYLNALNVSFYLTVNQKGVQKALIQGHSASIYVHSSLLDTQEDDVLRVAFDNNSVWLNIKSPKTSDEQELQAFSDLERINSFIPINDGSLKPFLSTLHQLQIYAPKKIRIALVTAHDIPLHERAIRILIDWDFELHDAFFLGSLNKRDFLKEFNTDIFFDDLDVIYDVAS